MDLDFQSVVEPFYFGDKLRSLRLMSHLFLQYHIESFDLFDELLSFEFGVVQHRFKFCTSLGPLAVNALSLFYDLCLSYIELLNFFAHFSDDYLVFWILSGQVLQLDRSLPELLIFPFQGCPHLFESCISVIDF